MSTNTNSGTDVPKVTPTSGGLDAAPNLEWIQIQKDVLSKQYGGDFGGIQQTESASDRFRRKFDENPLVPIGCIATGGVLTMGLISFYRRNSRLSQTMMRARIIAQGFTVFALVLGVFKAASVEHKKAQGS